MVIVLPKSICIQKYFVWSVPIPIFILIKAFVAIPIVFFYDVVSFFDLWYIPYNVVEVAYEVVIFDGVVANCGMEMQSCKVV